MNNLTRFLLKYIWQLCGISFVAGCVVGWLM